MIAEIMFWSRPKDLPRTEPTEPVAPSQDRRDAATEALGGVFRFFGEHALELPDATAEVILKSFDRWSRHLLLAAPHPLATQNQTRDPAARDFVGAARYFREHRKREAEHVNRALRELRGLLWTFVERLATSIPDDATYEAMAKDQLGRLKLALNKSSLDELKKEVLSTVTVLEQSARERQEKRRTEVQELIGRIDALREQLQDARAESETDPLTRLANRRALDAQLERSSVMSLLGMQEDTLILLDLDHFKKVNDTYGHTGGDAVLLAVAERLIRAFPRKMDCVARFGGEELAVILRETSLGDAMRLIERFLAELRSMTTTHGERTIRVTASAGVATSRSGENVKVWIERADAALYRAKRDGRDRAVASP